MENEILSKHYFQQSLENVCEKLETKIEKIESQKKIYSNEDLCKLLGVSKRTCQSWRNRNMIDYHQVGNKIYYTWENIQKFLEKYKVSARG